MAAARYACIARASGTGESETIMEYVKDEIFLPEEIPFRIIKTDGHQPYIHCHDCLEIDYVEQGEGHFIVEEKIYAIHPGDIFIINNLERHLVVAAKPCSMLVIVFDLKFVWDYSNKYDYLAPFFDRGPTFSNRIQAGHEKHHELLGYLLKLFGEYDRQEDGWQILVKALLQMFLGMLYRYCRRNNELLAPENDFQKGYGRIRPALDFIHKHFDGPIELDQLAEQLRMNRTYMCTYFKKVMKLTLFEYIEQVRINHSCILLKTTELPIAEISSHCGFNSVSYFNLVFKKILGASPSAYRKKTKNNESFSERC